MKAPLLPPQGLREGFEPPFAHLRADTHHGSRVGPSIKEMDMQNDGQRGESAQDPAEGRNDVPPPERGSPGGNPDEADEKMVEQVEKGGDSDPNPLAPPVNTGAGS